MKITLKQLKTFPQLEVRGIKFCDFTGAVKLMGGKYHSDKKNR